MMTAAPRAQSLVFYPYNFTRDLSNNPINTLFGNAARIGGCLYDCFPESLQNSSFDVVKKCLWGSLIVVPVIEVIASMSITYMVFSVLTILGLQLIVISTLRRGSIEDLNSRLARAIKNENLEEANFLFAAGAQHRFREFEDAVRSGDIAEVRRLLTANPTFAMSVDMNGETPLMWAAELGRTEILMELVQGGGDVNYQGGKLNWTALMRAVAYGHRATVEALLALNPPVNIDQRDRDGWTTLMMALCTNNTEDGRAIVTALLERRNRDLNLQNPDGLACREYAESLGSLRPSSIRALSNDSFLWSWYRRPRFIGVDEEAFLNELQRTHQRRVRHL